MDKTSRELGLVTTHLDEGVSDDAEVMDCLSNRGLYAIENNVHVSYRDDVTSFDRTERRGFVLKSGRRITADWSSPATKGCFGTEWFIVEKTNSGNYEGKKLIGYTPV